MLSRRKRPFIICDGRIIGKRTVGVGYGYQLAGPVLFVLRVFERVDALLPDVDIMAAHGEGAVKGRYGSGR